MECSETTHVGATITSIMEFSESGDIAVPPSGMTPELIARLHSTYYTPEIPGLKASSYAPWMVPVRYQKLKAIGTGAYELVSLNSRLIYALHFENGSKSKTRSGVRARRYTQGTRRGA